MKNWKTTASGLAGAAGSFVLFSSQAHMLVWPQWIMALAMFMAVGGLGSFAIVAKDYNVTGGTKTQ